VTKARDAEGWMAKAATPTKRMLILEVVPDVDFCDDPQEYDVRWDERTDRAMVFTCKGTWQPIRTPGRHEC
jgi:hypothetical protein